MPCWRARSATIRLGIEPAKEHAVIDHLEDPHDGPVGRSVAEQGRRGRHSGVGGAEKCEAW
jgi:hypothetical protein